MGYRQVKEKPTAAYILSLVGGILWLLASIVIVIYGIWLLATFSSIFSPYSSYTGFFGWSWTILLGLGIWMLVSATLIIVFAVKLNANPMEHSKWGALILVFSVIGGVSILALIGGILAIVYKPEPATGQPYGYSPPPQYTPPQSAQQNTARFCSSCGSAVNENAKFCPHCGKQLN